MSGPGRRTGTDPGILGRGAQGKGKPRIEIRDLKTRKLVKTIDLGSTSAHLAEKTLAGVYRNLGDGYYAVLKCVDKVRC